MLPVRDWDWDLDWDLVLVSVLVLDLDSLSSFVFHRPIEGLCIIKKKIKFILNNQGKY
jgi:hypothetical protein